MNLRLSKLTLNLTIAFSISISGNYLAAADDTALVNQFWSTTDNGQNAEIQSQLISSSSDVSTLYQLLKTGPTYRSDVPTGQQESIRIAADGTRFPFIFLVPDDYDPTHRYPVEFMLHGGVSRPEWEPGGGWWRRGI